MKSLSILSVIAILLAGIVGSQAQNEVKPTAYEKIPAIDLSQFSEKQHAAIIKRANSEGCDCGCKMTVAECRNDDQTCGKSITLVKAIIKDITGKDVKLAATKPEADDRIGKPLDIKFTSIDGQKIDVSKMKGKVVLIDFWATWCKPCIEIMPRLQKLHSTYAERGLEVLGVSIDEDDNRIKKINRRVEKLAIAYPIFIDAKEMPAWYQFKVKAIPAMFLLDREGQIVEQWTGKIDPEKVEQAVSRQLDIRAKAP